MRSLLLVLFALAAEAGSAQTESKLLKNEIGIMGDATLNGGSYRSQSAGIQYKHWRNKHVGYRFTAGLGGVSYDGQPRYFPSGYADTFYSSREQFRLPMIFIGGGIEAQKLLYKKLFIYLGAEVRAGFGQGHSDLELTKYYVEQPSPYAHFEPHTSTLTGIRYSTFWVGFSPLVGLKFNLRRFVIGTEFANTVNCLNRKSGNTRLLDVDFGPGELNERFYVSYRF